jgi:thiol-disulfide isomerase/thioredoxin
LDTFIRLFNSVNQYSYIFFSIGAVLVAAFALRRVWRVRWPLIGLAAVALAGLFTAGFFVLRPGDSDVDSLAAAEAAINSGKPTLVEFYSNYCAGCMTVRPLVDNLVSQVRDEFNDDVNILRVDIHTDFGRALRERYGFSFTPEFVMFNDAGAEVWRSHFPPSLDEVNNVVAASGISEIANPTTE